MLNKNYSCNDNYLSSCIHIVSFGCLSGNHIFHMSKCAQTFAQIILKVCTKQGYMNTTVNTIKQVPVVAV